MRPNYFPRSKGVLILAAVLILFGATSVVAMESSTTAQEQMTMAKIRQTDARISIGPVALSRIQEALSEKGFKPGPVDGIWGAKTAAAVKNFQIVQNLAPSGTLNIETIKSLGLGEILTGSLDELDARDLEEKNIGKSAQLFLSPFTVGMIQQSLRNKGIPAGPVDGIWGDKTRQGIQKFQSQKGIQPTNHITLSTLESLGLNQVTANLGFQAEGENLKYAGTLAASNYEKALAENTSQIRALETAGTDVKTWESMVMAMSSEKGMIENQELRGYFADPGAQTKIGTGVPLFAEHDFVRQIQKALVDNGYYPGPVDGKWGEWTAYAVGIYQRENKLPHTGYLTLATINKLLQ